MSTAMIDPVSHDTNNTGRSPARVPMDSLRRTALVAGALYLLSFISIPTLFLYSAVKDPGYLLGSGPDPPALAGVGTAVALYPVLKRQNQGVALAFVGTRTLEGAGLIAGVVALLTVVSLH